MRYWKEKEIYVVVLCLNSTILFLKNLFLYLSLSQAYCYKQLVINIERKTQIIDNYIINVSLLVCLGGI